MGTKLRLFAITMFSNTKTTMQANIVAYTTVKLPAEINCPRSNARAKLNVDAIVFDEFQAASELSPSKRAKNPNIKPTKINIDAIANGMMSLMISSIIVTTLG